MRSFFTTSTIILSSMSVFADEFDDIFHSETKFQKVSNQDASNMSSAAVPQTSSTTLKDPNPSARFGTSRSWNFYVEGEVIWFKPYNDEYSQLLASNTPPQNNTKFFKFNFQPGLRVLLGWNTNYDGWDLNLIYTGLNYSHSQSYLNQNAVNSSGVVTLYSQGTQTYTYYYNQGDLELGRMFKVSKGLQLRPHAAFRSLWLVQKNKLFTTDSVVNFAPYNFSNIVDVSRIKSYLPGVALGSNALWRFTRSWSILTDVTLAAMINNSKRSLTQNTKGQPVDLQRVAGMAHDGILGYDFTIGLEWDKNFSQDKFHLGIKLAYEQHGLLNINNVLDPQQEASGFFTSGLTNTFKPLIDNDFTLMGITLGARLDF